MIEIDYLAEVISENEGFDLEVAEMAIRGTLERCDPEKDFDAFYDEVLRVCENYSK